MKLKKELPLIAIVLLPLAYLAFVWNDIPNQVPVQWSIDGEVNRYGDKTELLLLTLTLTVLVYVLLLIAPKIDPKNKLRKMGEKYESIRFLVTTFVSVLALFLIYLTKNESAADPNYILLGVGLLYVILGNYFKTLKANYFIGIRTPWTLENEEVWKATHKLAGKMWFVGGILMLLSCLIFEKQMNFIVFISITMIISLVPVIYSYLKFRKLKNQLS